jgi:hypothetical protein
MAVYAWEQQLNNCRLIGSMVKELTRIICELEKYNT